MIYLKSPREIDVMHKSNVIVHKCLDRAEAEIRPGVTTRQLNDAIDNELSKYPGATPAFLGYQGYPAVSCISVNEEIVHGIPGDRVVKDGDIVSIDFGVYYNGYAGDSARTFLVGDVSDDAKKLSEQTRRGLFAGIEQMVPGNRLYDISKAISAIAKENFYGNIKNFCGHGIGKSMHESPSVFNYIEPKEPNVRLRAGMVFALEPMFTLGSSVGVVLNDNWTVVTSDKSLACHWELSVAITDDGPRILGNGLSDV